MTKSLNTKEICCEVMKRNLVEAISQKNFKQIAKRSRKLYGHTFDTKILVSLYQIERNLKKEKQEYGEIRMVINGIIDKIFKLFSAVGGPERAFIHFCNLFLIADFYEDKYVTERAAKFLLRHYSQELDGFQEEMAEEESYCDSSVWPDFSYRVPIDRLAARVAGWKQENRNGEE